MIEIRPICVLAGALALVGCRPEPPQLATAEAEPQESAPPSTPAPTTTTQDAADPSAVPAAKLSAESIATDQAGPTAIALSATDVFWIDEGNGDGVSGSIMKRSKSGGAVTALTTAQPSPSALVVDGATVFFTNIGELGSLTDPKPVGSVLAVPAAGGAVRTLATKQWSPRGLAVDAAFVYFGNPGVVEGKTTTVARVPKKGGAVKVMASGQRSPNGIATDATRLFWAAGGSCVAENGTMPSDGEILFAPLAKGAPKALASGLLCPESIALDDTSVYFTGAPGDAIAAVDKAGGPLRTLAGDQKGVRHLAVDDKFVYFANQESGVVGRVAKQGGPVEELAKVTDPGGIAVDASSVYLSDSKAGTVLRRAK